MSIESRTKMNDDWYKEFKGKCVACSRARESSRKNEMLCDCLKATNRGLPNRPGGCGEYFGTRVHKLFGCVYFKGIEV